jgi:signal peptidase I
MDIDFPFILTWAVIISGAVWLVDHLAFRPRRVRAADAFRASRGEEASDEAIESILKEPALTEYARSFFPVLLLVLVLRSFLAEPYQIPSSRWCRRSRSVTSSWSTSTHTAFACRCSAPS